MQCYFICFVRLPHWFTIVWYPTLYGSLACVWLFLYCLIMPTCNSLLSIRLSFFSSIINIYFLQFNSLQFQTSFSFNKTFQLWTLFSVENQNQRSNTRNIPWMCDRPRLRKILRKNPFYLQNNWILFSHWPEWSPNWSHQMFENYIFFLQNTLKFFQHRK